MNEAALALAFEGCDGKRFNQSEKWQLRTLVSISVVVFSLVLSPLAFSLIGFDFRGSESIPSITYSLLAWTVVLLLVLAAVFGLAHYAIDPDDLSEPTMGVWLLGMSVVAGHYAVQLFTNLSDSQLIASAWIIRVVMAIMLLIAITFMLVTASWQQRIVKEGRVVVLAVVVLLVVAAVTVVIRELLGQYSLAELANLSVYVMLPAMLFVLSAGVIRFRRENSCFNASLVVMALLLTAAELYGLLAYAGLMGGGFNVAISLQTMAALAPLLGMLCQYISSHRMVESAKRDLVINQRKLDVALETLTRSNERLMHANWHDHLTGAANREYFFKEAERAIARAKRNHQSVGFLYLDLDKFKQVNDTYGHGVGDEVLCCFAERIRGVMRAEDCLARVGGDEFVLMVENVDDHDHLSSVAGKIMDMLQLPVKTTKGELDVAVSIGISSFPETADVTDLVKHADIAMYEAKANETSKFQLYTRELSEQHAEKLELQRELPEALSSGQLSLAFQPIFDPSFNKPVSVEALLRWEHPQKGVISPAKFIPIAEKSTFINTLGNWVFEQVCQQLAFWRESYGFELSIGINVSVRQLYTDALVRTIRRCLIDYSIPAADIMLEITEGQLIQDLQACQGTISALKNLGVTIALDDYGSGFASITHLRNLPIDFLKIDRSLIRNAHRNPQNRVLTRTTIELAHSLDLPVIAEGIEEPDELELVREYSCDFVQGYYLARPMDSEQCTAFLMAELGSNKAVV